MVEKRDKADGSYHIGDDGRVRDGGGRTVRQQQEASKNGAKKGNAVQQERKEDKKKEFLKILENTPTTVKEAAARIGRDSSTVYNWCRDDPDFKETMRTLLDKNQRDMRLREVEDSLFKRIVTGRASAAETIFWLKRHSGEWRKADHVELEHSGEVQVEDRRKAEEELKRFENQKGGLPEGQQEETEDD